MKTVSGSLFEFFEVDKLYKIVLVDDEKLSIKSLAKSIKWELFGFFLAGVFTNGFVCQLTI